ncbi:hypothetical protein Ancab_031830 [Ancistrocladus abbreviatus]
MEESAMSTCFDGEIIGIKFGLAAHHEVSKSSISECPISHASQLTNPFLGLPLEFGKCESCGTAEPGKCEGHFGYIELPIPVYHPSHVTELRKMLGLLCLKCLKLKTHKLPMKTSGLLESLLAPCCEETSHISIKESKTTDGAFFLELRLPSRSRVRDGAWNFLERYGYRYGDGPSRTLLPSEVSVILKKLPDETKKKLAKKGYFPQDGYILRYLPVPPNCLSVPDISDGVVVMSSDLSITMLKKVLRQIEIIKSSRSGEPNFESHEVEANDLQVAIVQYLQVRGTGKALRDVSHRYGFNKEVNDSSTKAWLEKMRTLFISKGSGFSSRSVITGDAYKKVNEIGLPSEIAQKITFEERVNVHNINYLQSLVDNNLCLTFRDGHSTYSLREGSKGHTFLRPGQVVHRRIMDGDMVFINRPPTTHKHSLQALYVYIHEDHTVKINPLMCSPLAADFDGDCVHLFYPQSLPARAEVLELFSVEKQLLSSHTGNLNLQLATDSLLSLKTMFSRYFLDKASAQQLAMFASTPLPPPALRKSPLPGPLWTALQVLQTALPSDFDCSGDRHLIRGSDIVKIDFNRDAMQSMINEIVSSIFFDKGPKEALNFFDSLQPLLMEHLYVEGFSVGLRDFFIPTVIMQNIQKQVQDVSLLLFQLRSSYNELIQLQLENYIRLLKVPVVNFILKSSALGNLIDSKSDSSINKVVQQIGFLGLQLSDRGKFYSRYLVDDVSALFQRKYPFCDDYPSEEFGLVRNSFFHGLDPYEAMVHSIATREVIIRSSRGLAEPGTLFKNLMAILRDVAICYDGTVRNISSNSVIQFDYGFTGQKSQSLFPAGEPVGVLAATAMSNPAYKAVLDSSPSSNSSWEMMKEILFCRVNFRNDINDRRVILYLHDCACCGKYCRENASYLVKNLLRKISLRDAAVEFLIEYKSPEILSVTSELGTGLVGHIHLNKALLNDSNINMHDILQKCQDEVNLFRKKKNFSYYFRTIHLSVSECCFFQHGSKWCDMPCLKFFWQDMSDSHLEKTSHIMADVICPVLLDTIIKGDPRISTVNIIWISPDSTTWIRGPRQSRKGELAVEVVLEQKAVKQSGDAWRIVMDCCLPVFHLIDTRRSIPYATKQIQDLLGISCAFDQAVQRLSTSVTMVAKGVLKEHLILLASSMTCSGNLIGFNTSGIKALCRALGVQVPFTEATLYTPRKCFERAAEKHHMDSLSSIVASCSWGKRVAVGTGAKFDILWDKKETVVNQGAVDVYNFLQLVRGSSEEELGTGCLGDDIENFELEDEYMEQNLSPEHGSEAVFEETAEMELDLDNQAPYGGMSHGTSWDKVPSLNTASSTGNGWNVSKSDGWSSWEPKKAKSEVDDSSRSDGSNALESWKGPSQLQPLSAWGDQVSEADEAGPIDVKLCLEKVEASNNWGKEAKALSTSDNWEEFQKAPSKSAASWENQEAGMSVSNGKNMELQVGSDSTDKNWTQTKQSVDLAAKSWCTSPGEEPKDAENSPGWNIKSGGWKSEWAQHDSNSKKSKSETSVGWGSSAREQQSLSCHGWASRDGGGNGSEKTSAWGQTMGSSCKKNDPENAVHLDSSDESHQQMGSHGWDSAEGGADSQSKTKSAWGQPLVSKSQKDCAQNAGNWGGSVKSYQPESSHGWDSGKSAADSQSKTKPAWGQPLVSKSQKDCAQNAGNWGGSVTSYQPESSHGWDSGKSAADSQSKTKSAWGQPLVSNSQNDCAQNACNWGGSVKSCQPASSHGWDSAKGAADSQGKTESPWGQPSGINSKKGDAQSVGDWGSSGKSNELASFHGKVFRKQSADDGSKTESACGQHSGSNSREDYMQGDSNWDSFGKSRQPASPHGWDSGKVGSDNDSKTGPWEQPSGSISKKDYTQCTGNRGSPDQSSELESSQGWESERASMDTENNTQQSPWGQPGASTWKKNSIESRHGWGSSNESHTGDGNDAEPKSPWGHPSGSAWRKNRPEGGSGWGSSNSGEWKNKKNRPSTPRLPKENSSVPLTATRQRVDIFSSEEQDMLIEIEAIMHSIRRIMHQPGYNDGDPLSADDQLYILDNVFGHHPDKAVKMGAGIDYIMVTKHTSFQDSRCFYVVATDGQKEDFSYRKCLENLIRAKYPDLAESFITKYFRRQRPGGNREQNNEDTPVAN